MSKNPAMFFSFFSVHAHDRRGPQRRRHRLGELCRSIRLADRPRRPGDGAVESGQAHGRQRIVRRGVLHIGQIDEEDAGDGCGL